MTFFLLLSILGAGVQGPFINKTFIEPEENSNLLFLEKGTVDAGIPQDLQETSTNRFVVKFDHPITENDRSLLKQNGLIVEGYLPDYAFLVTCKKDNVASLMNRKSLSWASPYKAEWKAAPSLFGNENLPDTIHVWLFNDALVNEISEEIKTNLGAVVYSSHDGLNKTLLISIDRSRIMELASLNAVRWIEPFYAPEFFNDNAQWVLQSWKENIRDLWTRGLDGTGVVASTGDAGLTTTHVMFRDSTTTITTWGDFPDHRKVIAYQPSAAGAVFGDDPSVDYHGTHTACTVCGEDSYWGGTSPYDGMAPGAKLYFVDVGNNASGIAYPADYNDMYLMPRNGNQGGKAKLMSNSWGSGGALRSYDIPSRQTDEFIWNHPDFLIFYSAGNSGGSGISPPATAKNIVTVGATGNGYSATTPASFSSLGPTADGRLKPTITAPGMLMSANGGGTDSYQFMEGTSMSSPAAAGICVLLAQYFREGWYPSGTNTFKSQDSLDPSAALLKALLINSAIADFSNPIPNNSVGWGRICLDSVLYFQGATKQLFVHDNTTGLETGDDAVYLVDVTGKDWPLRATLVWSDPPPEISALKKLVNDLDIQAESPTGKIYKGSVFADGFSTTGGTKDATNVEECIRINKPELGTWKIHVLAANVPQGPQPYALALTGVLEPKEVSFEVSGTRIDDSSSPSPNKAIDPGESVLIFPRLFNKGNVEAANVNATIACSDSNLTVTDSSAEYGTIQTNVYAEGSGFAVTLSPDASPGDTLGFVLIAESNGGSEIDTVLFQTIVGLSGIEEKRPEAVPVISCPFVLKQGSKIHLELPGNQRVVLEIFDVTGRRVELLANGNYNAGTHEFVVQDRKTQGVYFIFFNTNGHQQRIKTIVLGH